jgi:hypothetical protein
LSPIINPKTDFAALLLIALSVLRIASTWTAFSAAGWVSEYSMAVSRVAPWLEGHPYQRAGTSIRLYFVS